MSATPMDQIVATGTVAEAEARARDAADAALAESLLNGTTSPDAGDTLSDAPDTSQPPAPRRPLNQIGGDATGDLITDDFGLDGNLRGMMETALEQAFADDLTTDSPADTAATPAPAPTPPAVPHSAEQGGAGGGGDAAVGAAPADAPPVPAPDDFSLDAYARDYFGTNLDRQSAQQLFGVLGGLQSASPEQRMQIDAILSGRQVGAVPPVQSAPGVLPAAPTAPDAIPGLPPRPTDEYEAQVYDRMILPLAQAQASQVAALRADIERTTQQQLATQQQQMAARIDTAEADWRTQHPILSDGEFDALRQRIISSGTFPALIAAHHGDPDAATHVAYEQHFWSDEGLRGRALANVASGRDAFTALPDAATQVGADQAALEAGRRALAGSVAGGGGHAPVRTAGPPKTPGERKASMINEIAAAMSGQQE